MVRDLRLDTTATAPALAHGRTPGRLAPITGGGGGGGAAFASSAVVSGSSVTVTAASAVGALDVYDRPRADGFPVVATGASPLTFSLDPGSYSLYVYDDAEQSADSPLAVTVEAGNSAPTVSAPIADQTGAAGDAAFTVDLDTVFSDGDADALTYSLVGTPTSASLAGTRSKDLTVSKASVVTETVTVRADDGNGGTVDDVFDVTVSAASSTPELNAGYSWDFRSGSGATVAGMATSLANGLDATLVGGVGHSAAGVTSDGVDDYVTVHATANAHIVPPTDFAIAMRVRVDTAPLADQVLFGWRGTGGNPIVSVKARSALNFRVAVKDDPGTTQDNNNTGAYSAGTFFTLELQFRGGAYYLYKDGVLEFGPSASFTGTTFTMGTLAFLANNYDASLEDYVDATLAFLSVFDGTRTGTDAADYHAEVAAL